MKRILTIAFAALLLASCGNSVKDQLIDLIEDNMADVKAAKTYDEYAQTSKTFDEGMDKLREANSEEVQKLVLEDKDVQDAFGKLMEAMVEKETSFSEAR